MAMESEGCAAVAENECRLRGETDHNVSTSFSIQDAGMITDILYFSLTLFYRVLLYIFLW